MKKQKMDKEKREEKEELFEPEEHVKQSSRNITPRTDGAKQVYSKEWSPADNETADYYTNRLGSLCFTVERPQLSWYDGDVKLGEGR